jgi:hypothetical protein
MLLALLVALAVAPFQTTEKFDHQKWKAHYEAIEELESKISTSSDQVWLEQIANFSDQDKYNGELVGPEAPKLRSAAYIRMAALGDSASIAALRRIESAAKANRRPERQPIARLAHSTPHFSAMPMETVTEKTMPDGNRYRVINSWLLDGDDLSLITNDGKSELWTRPKPIPRDSYFGKPGSVVLRIHANEYRLPLPSKEWLQNREIYARKTEKHIQRPQKWILDVEQIFRDTDNDGLTDIEERRLALKGNNPDSDGDGISDGQDPCPDLSDTQRSDEDDIIRKTFFALYGIRKSQQAIWVSGSRKVCVFGNLGPIVFWPGPDGSVKVSWKIVEATADTATAYISDYEGPLAASSRTVYLRKIDGEWFVVGLGKGWIS